jgi:hypothetical protein
MKEEGRAFDGQRSTLIASSPQDSAARVLTPTG